MAYPRTPIVERFWPKVYKTEGCWYWIGSTRNGYGQLFISKSGGKAIIHPAHRVAYELLVAPIPDGYQVDHLCRNKRCVNPEHLEAVTPAENYLRGLSPHAFHSWQTHCKRGHSFDAANTYYSKLGRHCRACGAAHARRYRRQRRQRDR